MVLPRTHLPPGKGGAASNFILFALPRLSLQLKPLLFAEHVLPLRCMYCLCGACDL